MVQVLQSGEKLLTSTVLEERDIANYMIYYLNLKLDLCCYVSQCSDAVTNTQERQFQGGVILP